MGKCCGQGGNGGQGGPGRSPQGKGVVGQSGGQRCVSNSHNEQVCHGTHERRRDLIDQLKIYLEDFDERPCMSTPPETGPNATRPLGEYPEYMKKHCQSWMPPNPRPPLITSTQAHEIRVTSDYEKMKNENSEYLSYKDGRTKPPPPSCDCAKRNGLQDQCPRSECSPPTPQCLARNPGPCCPPSLGLTGREAREGVAPQRQGATPQSTYQQDFRPQDRTPHGQNFQSTYGQDFGTSQQTAYGTPSPQAGFSPVQGQQMICFCKVRPECSMFVPQCLANNSEVGCPPSLGLQGWAASEGVVPQTTYQQDFKTTPQETPPFAQDLQSFQSSYELDFGTSQRTVCGILRPQEGFVAPTPPPVQGQQAAWLPPLTPCDCAKENGLQNLCPQCLVHNQQDLRLQKQPPNGENIQSTYSRDFQTDYDNLSSEAEFTSSATTPMQGQKIASPKPLSQTGFSTSNPTTKQRQTMALATPGPQEELKAPTSSHKKGQKMVKPTPSPQAGFSSSAPKSVEGQNMDFSTSCPQEETKASTSKPVKGQKMGSPKFYPQAEFSGSTSNPVQGRMALSTPCPQKELKDSTPSPIHRQKMTLAILFPQEEFELSTPRPVQGQEIGLATNSSQEGLKASTSTSAKGRKMVFAIVCPQEGFRVSTSTPMQEQMASSTATTQEVFSASPPIPVNVQKMDFAVLCPQTGLTVSASCQEQRQQMVLVTSCIEEGVKTSGSTPTKGCKKKCLCRVSPSTKPPEKN